MKNENYENYESYSDKKEKLLKIFMENSDEIIRELEKGVKIVIKKNDVNYNIYKDLIKRIK